MLDRRIWAMRSFDNCSPVCDLRRFPRTPIISTGGGPSVAGAGVAATAGVALELAAALLVLLGSILIEL